MIPKMFLGLILAAIWSQDVNGASFSKVYVQSGPEVVPVEYVNYGAPAVYADTQIAQLSAAPIRPVGPNAIPPCVSPCVVPGSNIAPVAQLPSANILAYNAPNVPVVVAPKVDNGYEYSYVVYDENTGDRKAQREFSDGAVVRGEYSFIQPDGYVREVKYTADDLTGFNVVVKKILPDTVHGTKTVITGEPVPCAPTKSEALKVEHGHHEPAVEDHEGHDHGHEPSHETEHEHEPDHDHVHEPSHDHGHEASHDHGHEPSHDHGHEPSHEEPTIEGHEEPAQEEHSHVEVHEIEHVVPEPEHHGHSEHHEHEPEHEHGHEEPAPEIHEAPTHDAHAAPEHEAHESHEEPAHEAPAHHEVHVSHEEVHEAGVPQIVPAGNAIVAYDDIVRCVQAKLQAGALKQDVSPLTYIILPGGRPC